MSTHPTGIPSISVRTLENYGDRLEGIRRDADAGGLGTLAYLIDMAKLTAEGEVKNAEHERQMRKPMSSTSGDR